MTTSGAKLRTHRTGLGFLPSDISGLILWLDATQFGLADGSVVTTWPDSSGSGNSVTQATAGKRPTLKTGIMGSRAVVRFVTASQQHLANAVSVTLKPVTVLAVLSATSTADYQTILGPVLGAMFQFRVDAGGLLSMVKATAVVLGNSSGTVAAGTPTLVEGTYSAVGAYAFYLNGTASGSGTNDQTIAAQAFSVGSNQTTGEFFGGDLAELVVYNSVLSGADRLKVERYLGAKYGIAVA